MVPAAGEADDRQGRQHVERQRHEDGSGDATRAGWAPRLSSGRPRRGRTVGAQRSPRSARCAMPRRRRRRPPTPGRGARGASPRGPARTGRSPGRGSAAPGTARRRARDARARRRWSNGAGGPAGFVCTGSRTAACAASSRVPKSAGARRSSTTVPAVRSAKPRRSGEASADTGGTAPDEDGDQREDDADAEAAAVVVTGVAGDDQRRPREGERDEAREHRPAQRGSGLDRRAGRAGPTRMPVICLPGVAPIVVTNRVS